MRLDQLTNATKDESINIGTALQQLRNLGSQNQLPTHAEQSAPKQTMDSDNDFVSIETLSDGTKVWVIKKETSEQRMAKLGERYVRTLKVMDQSDPLFDAISVKSHDDGFDPVAILTKKRGEFDQDVVKLNNVKKVFEHFDYGPNGLVPKGSPEAESYKKCIELVRSKRVRLPTVEEFEKARKQALEERKKTMENNLPTPPVMPVAPTTTTPTAPTSEEVRNVLAQATPNTADYSPDMLPPKRNLAADAAKNVAKAKPIDVTKTLVEHSMNPKAPIDNTSSTDTPTPVTPEVEPAQSVTFDVKEGQAESFFAALPDIEKQKVQAAKIIKLNEVRTIDVPTAITTIDNITDYRKIVPKKVTGEYVEVPLPNSGYIATMAGAGSLAMATIVADQNNGADVRKQYQFCFDNLVTTSIGQMSYNDFILKTSPTDLPALIGGIYRASMPEENEIMLTCGNPKCRKDYKIKYRTTEITDVDAFDDETKVQINDIIESSDVIGDAKEAQANSPVMTAKTYMLDDDTYITIKIPDGQMTIERSTVIEQVGEAYGDIVAFLFNFVKELKRKLIPAGFTTPQWFSITDPAIIAEELYNMDDTSVSLLMDGVGSLKVYDEFKYAFKGPIICPHCGRKEDKIPCDINDLVFLRVSKITNKKS